MAADTASARGEAAAHLLAPLAWAMALVERPFAFVQRHAGLGGVAALFLAPNMAVFGVFVLIPMAINLAFSFTGGSAVFLADRPFVGLDQYTTLLTCRNYFDPFSCRQDAFWTAIGNTGFFVVAQVTALVLCALITALILNREMRARGFWRAVFFFPVLLSPVVVALIWKWILQRDGVLNALGGWLGYAQVLWLGERGWATFWAIFVTTWAHMGFYTLILLAGLQAIPGDLYEAAQMDGTPRWRVLARITLPLLWPNLIVVIVLAVIRGVQTFDEIYVLTGGGPGSATLFLTQFIYQAGFADSNRNYGLASAASVLMAVILIVLSLVQLAATAWRRRGGAA